MGARFFAASRGALDTQGALGRPRPLGQFLDHVGGRLGGAPDQLSGNRSTKILSPAVMVLTVTRRDSDSRIAMPSGSRRAEPT